MVPVWWYCTIPSWYGTIIASCSPFAIILVGRTYSTTYDGKTTRIPTDGTIVSFNKVTRQTLNLDLQLPLKHLVQRMRANKPTKFRLDKQKRSTTLKSLSFIIPAERPWCFAAVPPTRSTTPKLWRRRQPLGRRRCRKLTLLQNMITLTIAVECRVSFRKYAVTE